jgi:multimeric flavodoxin WrbA
MIISCISASNIKHAGENSTSFKVCQLAKDLIINQYNKNMKVEIISLVDYELKPCSGCGRCFHDKVCIHDKEFNQLFSQLSKCDGMIIVSAHYAPIPSKLAILLEKVEQLAFLPRFHNEEIRSPLYKKPVSIIAHGGGTEDIIRHYKGPVLDTITNALSWPVEMDIVGINDEWPNGIAIPVKNVIRNKDSVFPVQEYDWDDVRNRIEPLINNFLLRISLYNLED